MEARGRYLEAARRSKDHAQSTGRAIYDIREMYMRFAIYRARKKKEWSVEGMEETRHVCAVLCPSVERTVVRPRLRIYCTSVYVHVVCAKSPEIDITEH